MVGGGGLVYVRPGTQLDNSQPVRAGSSLIRSLRVRSEFLTPTWWALPIRLRGDGLQTDSA